MFCLDEATTPPIPASSPGNDSMEMSPLPHKVPYHMQLLKSPCAKLEMRMQSSPPVPSPADLEPKTMDPPRRPLLAEYAAINPYGLELVVDWM